jgi:hypothetical protein
VSTESVRSVSFASNQKEDALSWRCKVSSLGTSSGVTGDKNIHVVIFSGKQEEWENWKEKFFIKAAIGGYEGILNGDDSISPTHKADDNSKIRLTEDQQLIVDLNKKGFGDLVLSIDCTTPNVKVVFGIVKGSKENENPGGNLRMAYLCLKSKYEPSTTPQAMKLTQESNLKTLQPDQAPDISSNKLDALKVKMGELDHEVSNKSLILHVLNNLNDQYVMEHKILEHRMQILKKIKRN